MKNLYVKLAVFETMKHFAEREFNNKPFSPVCFGRMVTIHEQIRIAKGRLAELRRVI